MSESTKNSNLAKWGYDVFWREYGNRRGYRTAHCKTPEDAEAVIDEITGVCGGEGSCTYRPHRPRKTKHNPAMSTPVKAAIGVGVLAAIGGAVWYFTKGTKSEMKLY